MDARAALPLLFAWALLPTSAYAQCTSPTTPEGGRNFFSPDMRLCAGSIWNDFLTDGTTGASCTGLGGQMQWNATNKAYDLCNGSNWRPVRDAGAACTPSATLTYVTKLNDTINLDDASSMEWSPDKNILYVMNQWTGRLVILNTANTPAAPVIIGSVVHSNAGEATDLLVKGDYAYVLARTQRNLVVFNISNPAAPTYVTRVQATVVAEMANPSQMAFSEDGTRIFVAAWNSGSGNDCFFHTFNLSNPAAPTHEAKLNLSTAAAVSEWCEGIVVKGNYAFVTSNDGGPVSVNVTNPAAPTYVSKVINASMYQMSSGALSADGNYLIGATSQADSWGSFNISNPAAMTFSDSLTNASLFTGSYAVRRAGKYFISSSLNDDSIVVIDGSNPASLVLRSSATSATHLNDAADVAIKGRYIYASGLLSEAVAIYDMGCDPDTTSYEVCTKSAEVDYDSTRKVLNYCDGSVKRPMTPPVKPCSNSAIGAACSGTTALYAGSIGSYQYMVTPGGCTNSATPTCSGGSDTVDKYFRGSTGTSVDIAGLSFFTGLGDHQLGDVNTNILVNDASIASDSAADFCATMSYGGYNDWYLPNIDELNLLYTNRAAIGGFTSNTYNSSTESSSLQYMRITFSTGDISAVNKNSLVKVRCVRRD